MVVTTAITNAASATLDGHAVKFEMRENETAPRDEPGAADRKAIHYG
jgi:hypothetical protein